MSKVDSEDINQLILVINAHICNIVDDRAADADDSMAGFSSYGSGELLHKSLTEIFKKLER